MTSQRRTYDQYTDRSKTESDMYVPSFGDIWQRAKDVYSGGMLDWGAAEWQKYEDQAFHYYMGHLYSMEDNQGWPEGLVQELRTNALAALQEGHNAEQFWAIILSTEQEVIRNAGYNPVNLRNYYKHMDFLDAVYYSAEGYRDVLEEYAPHKQLGGGGETKDDLKKLLIAGFAVLIGVQLLKK